MSWFDCDMYFGGRHQVGFSWWVRQCQVIMIPVGCKKADIVVHTSGLVPFLWHLSPRYCNRQCVAINVFGLLFQLLYYAKMNKGLCSCRPLPYGNSENGTLCTCMEWQERIAVGDWLFWNLVTWSCPFIPERDKFPAVWPMSAERYRVDSYRDCENAAEPTSLTFS